MCILIDKQEKRIYILFNVVKGRKLWTSLKKKNPDPGFYVYVRDFDTPKIWEIGWAMGETGKMKVAVVNDPTMTPLVFDEWQTVPMPER